MSHFLCAAVSPSDHLDFVGAGKRHQETPHGTGMAGMRCSTLTWCVLLVSAHAAKGDKEASDGKKASRKRDCVASVTTDAEEGRASSGNRRVSGHVLCRSLILTST